MGGKRRQTGSESLVPPCLSLSHSLTYHILLWCSVHFIKYGYFGGSIGSSLDLEERESEREREKVVS
jgi:hypothetical protein